MNENLLQLGVEDLFTRLHQALAGLHLQAVRSLSRAVEQHWAFAVARRDRDKTRTLCSKLLEAASTAAALQEEHGAISGWNQRWLALSEMGGLVLAVDADSAAAEDRERLKSFEHAERVVLLLHRQGIATSSDIQRHLQEAGIPLTPQACWNHLNRLSKMGVVQRVQEGLYRLSPRGQEAARLLAQETKTPEKAPVFVTKPYAEVSPKEEKPRRRAQEPLQTLSPARSSASPVTLGINNLVQHGVISQGVSSHLTQDLGDEALSGSFLDRGYQPVPFGRQAMARR